MQYNHCVTGGSTSSAMVVPTFFEDFGSGREPTHWNAADVLRDDGLLQHGTIVDIASGGLIIDYDDGQGAQLVSYGKVFRCVQPHRERLPFVTDFHAGDAMLVLLRDGPQQPWIWRAGRLLMDCSADPEQRWYESVASVEVLLRGKPSQLRWPRSHAEQQARMIVEGTFVIRECPMPVLHVQSPVWQLAVDYLSLNEIALPVCVSNEKMIYLQAVSSTQLVSRNLDYQIHKVQKKVEDLVKKGMEFVDNRWRRALPRIVIHAEDAEPGDAPMLNLPVGVLVEVFSYLDSMDRSRSRRVCSWFDWILTAAIFPDVVITIRLGYGVIGLQYPKYTIYPVDYPIVACLLHCLTAYTSRVVIIHGCHDAVMEVSHHLHTTVEQRRQNAQKPLLIVASQCEMDMDGEYGRELEELSSTNHPLLFTRCTLIGVQFPTSHLVLPLNGRLELDVNVSVRIGKAWELVDCSVPPVDGAVTAEWVRRAEWLRPKDQEAIRQVLFELCSADPRDTNFYAGHLWAFEDMAHMDVTKLPAVCRFALNNNIPRSFRALRFTDDL